MFTGCPIYKGFLFEGATVLVGRGRGRNVLEQLQNVLRSLERSAVPAGFRGRFAHGSRKGRWRVAPPRPRPTPVAFNSSIETAILVTVIFTVCTVQDYI